MDLKENGRRGKKYRAIPLRQGGEGNQATDRKRNRCYQRVGGREREHYQFMNAQFIRGLMTKFRAQINLSIMW